MNSVTFRRLAGAAWLVVVCASACGKESSSDVCTRGNEGCMCYPNSTCNPGLECLSSLCVSRNGSGGSSMTQAGSGGSSESGAGANSESGGAGAETSSAGAPAVQGGSDSGGAAGLHGGSDAGGSDDAGGTLGTGGGGGKGQAGGGNASGGAASGGAAGGKGGAGGTLAQGGTSGSGGSTAGAGGKGGSGGSGGSGGAACSGAGGASLFFDNFECGTALWTPQVAGSFALVMDGSNTYQRTDLVSSLALTSAGSSSWVNVLIEVRVKALAFGAASSLSYAAIYGRFVDTSNYFAIAWQGDGTVATRQRTNGAGSDSYNRDTLLTTGEWHTLGLELSGTTTRILVDRVPIATSIGTTTPAGRIAVSTFNASARFDDVRVTALP